MRERILQLIGSGISQADLMLAAEQYGISNRLSFILIRSLLMDGDICRTEHKGIIYLMIRDIELDFGLSKEYVETYL